MGRAPLAQPLRGLSKVIIASSLGTAFEWYDFFVYASLAPVIGRHFLAGATETASFLFALLLFSVGFVLRPFGALFFGGIGDRSGRKRAFISTMGVMGLATFAIGLLPVQATIGPAAPMLLILCRVLQGLALGGEYGGAVIYVAEHVPAGRRGLATAAIQTTASIGFLLSLLAVSATRTLTGADFDVWGWRIPFLLSLPLLGLSLWMRARLAESPVFLRMQEEGRQARTPVREVLLSWPNLSVVLKTLVGLIPGMAMVWVTGQIYVFFHLVQVLKLDPQAANGLMAPVIVAATPFYLLFGHLADRRGRKPVVLTAMAVGALAILPLFAALGEAVNPGLMAATRTAPVLVRAEPAACTFQFDPLGKVRFTSPCDIARAALAKRGIPYANVAVSGPAEIVVGTIRIVAYDAAAPDATAAATRFGLALNDALSAAGYPTAATTASVDRPAAMTVLFGLMVLATAVYGPTACWLSELFPARIRYTALSLTYHLGSGIFSGFMPTITFAIVAATGGLLSGLWYPVGVSAFSALAGILLLPETLERPRRA